MALLSNTYTKEYAYYLRGGDIAIVERDFTDNTSNTFGEWKSANTTVEDGLMIEYCYKPFYQINNSASMHAIGDIKRKTENTDGLWANVDLALYSGNQFLEIVLSHAGDWTAGGGSAIYVPGKTVCLYDTKWNDGIYKVRDSKHESVTLGGASVTRTVVLLETLISSRAVENEDMTGIVTTLPRTPVVYFQVSTVGDPHSFLPVDDYFAQALVYYVKARLAEDQGNIEGKEYFMREFKAKLSQGADSRISGKRTLNPGIHAIK